MSVGVVMTRRLRLRRIRRSTARLVRDPDVVVGLPDLDDVLAELCVWAAGMPWVVESPCDTRDGLKLFMLDCEPLSRHEPWFAINAFDDDTLDSPGIFVSLPNAVADRATSFASWVGIEPIARRRSITAIGLPTCEGEFQALQQLLEITYVAAFGASS